MVISSKNYEASHGKKPAGFRDTWRFTLSYSGGRSTETVKFDHCEFSQACSLLRGYAKTRGLSVAVAEVTA